RDFHVTGVQTCALPIWPRLGISIDVKLPDQWKVLFFFHGMFLFIHRKYHVALSAAKEYISKIDIFYGYLFGSSFNNNIIGSSGRSEERRVGNDCSCLFV